MEERVNHGGPAPSCLLAQPQQMREKWKSLGFKSDGHFFIPNKESERARGSHASPMLPTCESSGKWVACNPHVANTEFFFFYLLNFNFSCNILC
jgi:hypothetical protein